MSIFDLIESKLSKKNLNIEEFESELFKNAINIIEFEPFDSNF